jgi:hypothetical protein
MNEWEFCTELLRYVQHNLHTLTATPGMRRGHAISFLSAKLIYAVTFVWRLACYTRPYATTTRLGLKVPSSRANKLTCEMVSTWNECPDRVILRRATNGTPELLNHIYNRVRTSQETHVSATKTNRLILFRETVTVHCEKNTQCGKITKVWCVKAGRP